MSVEAVLKERAQSKCELCSSDSNLQTFAVAPENDSDSNTCVLLCEKCASEQNDIENLDVNHWRCLNDSMWSEHAPVQVMAFRVLSYLSNEGWAQDLKEQMYMEDSVREWAEKTLSSDKAKPTVDSNGTKLQEGDTVTLIKDLDVKGAGFTAKRGTVVKKIALTDNPEHIEGRVNGTRIVLVSAYLKKVN